LARRGFLATQSRRGEGLRATSSVAAWEPLTQQTRVESSRRVAESKARPGLRASGRHRRDPWTRR
jgi:hypothetical protein